MLGCGCRVLAAWCWSIVVHAVAIFAEIVPRRMHLAIGRGQRRRSGLGAPRPGDAPRVVLPRPLRALTPTLIGQAVRVIKSPAIGYVVVSPEVLHSWQCRRLSPATTASRPRRGRVISIGSTIARSASPRRTTRRLRGSTATGRHCPTTRVLARVLNLLTTRVSVFPRAGRAGVHAGPVAAGSAASWLGSRGLPLHSIALNGRGGWWPSTMVALPRRPPHMMPPRPVFTGTAVGFAPGAAGSMGCCGLDFNVVLPLPDRVPRDGVAWLARDDGRRPLLTMRNRAPGSGFPARPAVDPTDLGPPVPGPPRYSEPARAALHLPAAPSHSAVRRRAGRATGQLSASPCPRLFEPLGFRPPHLGQDRPGGSKHLRRNGPEHARRDFLNGVCCTCGDLSGGRAGGCLAMRAGLPGPRPLGFQGARPVRGNGSRFVPVSREGARDRPGYTATMSGSGRGRELLRLRQVRAGLPGAARQDAVVALPRPIPGGRQPGACPAGATSCFPARGPDSPSDDRRLVATSWPARTSPPAAGPSQPAAAEGARHRPVGRAGPNLCALLQYVLTDLLAFYRSVCPPLLTLPPLTSSLGPHLFQLLAGRLDGVVITVTSCRAAPLLHRRDKRCCPLRAGSHRRTLDLDWYVSSIQKTKNPFHDTVTVEFPARRRLRWVAVGERQRAVPRPTRDHRDQSRLRPMRAPGPRRHSSVGPSVACLEPCRYEQPTKQPRRARQSTVTEFWFFSRRAG